jgi:NAD+ synthase (glutamine-hydrolysing)
MKVCLLQSNPILGNLTQNFDWLKTQILKQDADLFIAPEMALLGYPADDLISDNFFIEKQQVLLEKFKSVLKKNQMLIIGGVAVNKKERSNSAFLISKNKLILQNKINLPNYGVFDEKRYFTAGKKIEIISFNNKKILVLICEDFWDKKIEKFYINKKIDLCVAINASPFEINKFSKRQNRAIELTKKIKAPLVYLNMIGGQDDLVFDGESFILNEENKLILRLNPFRTQVKTLDLNKINPTLAHRNNLEEELILNACILGTRDYLRKNKIDSVYIGLSGGIDSALVAFIASKAIPAHKVNCIMMRSKFTSHISCEDAKKLAKNLGVQYKNKDVMPIINSINESLTLDFKNKQPDVTEENIQARSRGLVLMALANKHKAVVLSTSNKSESAVGYSTLYGDMVGAYAPLKDISKTKIYNIVNYINQKNKIIPQRIITRPPSAELRENQKDQDTLPDYAILDRIIELFIDDGLNSQEIIKHGFKPQLVKKIVKLILGSEFKRRQSPPGPKISRKAFGRERRFPITNNYLG